MLDRSDWDDWDMNTAEVVNETQRIIVRLKEKMPLKDAIHCATLIMTDFSTDLGCISEPKAAVPELYFKDWTITSTTELWKFEHADGGTFSYLDLKEGLKTLLEFYT